MKIVYCINQLECIGGTERITIAKANALSEVPGNVVYAIVAYNRKANATLLVSSKVKIVDLNVHYYDNRSSNRISGLLFYYKKRKEHRKKLELALNSIMPDIVISVGGTEKLFLPRINIHSNPVRIREMHFHKYYRRIMATGLFEKCLARIQEFMDYYLNINRYDKIVVLTKEDKNDNWKNNDKVLVIPNPVTEIPKLHASLKNKVVMAAGRLIKVKNFSSLISAWARVASNYPDWHLKIFGDGEKKQQLQTLIDSNNLSKNITLCGFTDDIYTEIAKASIYVLSSICEGFSLVIIEAMGCGLPVVSYSCQYGPRDIITDGKDGFLVPVNDEEELANKMMMLMSHDELRQKMGALALDKAGDYSMEKVVQKWMELFRKLVNSNIASV